MAISIICGCYRESGEVPVLVGSSIIPLTPEESAASQVPVVGQIFCHGVSTNLYATIKMDKA